MRLRRTELIQSTDIFLSISEETSRSSVTLITHKIGGIFISTKKNKKIISQIRVPSNRT